jgi:beta-galactosidase
MLGYLTTATTLTVCAILAACVLPKAARAALPGNVETEWGLDTAHRESTPTRGRISINGLWQWQPAQSMDAAPGEAWGHAKVPAPWPGSRGNYMWRETQTYYAPEAGETEAWETAAWETAAWEDDSLRDVDVAWYRREITIPQEWDGRRIAVAAEYVNSYAAVHVNGELAGEIDFPGGDVDITSVVEAGATYTLSLFVAAMPLDAEIASYANSSEERRVRGSVQLRGLCGDVWLTSAPRAARIEDIAVTTSVADGEIALDVQATGLAVGEAYALSARIFDGDTAVAEFEGAPQAARHGDGGLRLTHAWLPDRLWDTHTPGNQYHVEVSLRDASGDIVDTYRRVRFGFREFVIDGRDFLLNGKRIHLFAVPLDNAQISAAAATYEGARETLRRLQSWGVNAVYTHNYGCQPGTHLGFTEILRAADDVGMLVCFSQPHFAQYEWDDDDADSANGYAEHAAFYVSAARNHPSVVMYSMSHNATGYSEDMNPDMMDGVQSARSQWAERNLAKAKRAASIVEELDPSRIVYHHAGGNNGPLHSSNFYLNFVPVQERSDWFEHWSQTSVKPLVLWEYGVPWDLTWTMYRGWHEGERDFGGAAVPWQLTVAEWNAQFLGDRAFDLNDAEIENLNFEASKWRAGETWHRWDYPNRITSKGYSPDKEEVWARYIHHNWRAFRTWELSGFNAWGYGNYWAVKDGVERERRDLPIAWDALQRPGFSPDYIDAQYERMDTAHEAADWEPLAPAEALLRNNQLLLGYIAGAPARFTEQGHNFTAGDLVEKQIIVINDTRETVEATCTWALDLPQPLTGSVAAVVETGDQARLPMEFALPDGLAPGAYAMTAAISFSTGATQTDTFTIHVLPQPTKPDVAPRVALFDPVGETHAVLSMLGVAFEQVDAEAELTSSDLLVIGKRALTADGAGPDLSLVADGLRVIVMEQSADVLEKRLGFRVQEYGLRQAFPRVPDHPVLRGLQEEHLRDWQGEATLVPPRREYTLDDVLGPTIVRSGIKVPRAWRVGNRGNVASVIIEKPAAGDFLSIVDGGFGLQYSALLEYREGAGSILFCQMDVTRRSARRGDVHDAAAETLLANLLAYTPEPASTPPGSLEYVGDAAGIRHLTSAGYDVSPYTAGSESGPPVERILALGPGAAQTVTAADVEVWVASGGRILTVGVAAEELARLMPPIVETATAAYVAASFSSQGVGAPFAGVGPGETHIREPRELGLITGEAAFAGGLLAADDGAVVLCQVAPWQFDYDASFNLKMPFRRTSVLLSRLLGNMGARSSTPLPGRFAAPVAEGETRWLDGLYLDTPEEMDDPYRFFRW